MTNATTIATININSTNQSAPPPSTSSSSSNMSPLTAILSLLVIIAIPAFIYAFFFAINCPRIPLRRFRRSSSSGEGGADFSSDHNKKSGHLESVSTIKYTKGTHGEEYGSECPVCLSAFVEGDGVRQLSGCKHSFHVACIDRWLYSHSSCPLCRASVPNPVKRSNRPAPPQTEEDLRQGLPDAASLV